MKLRFLVAQNQTLGKPNPFPSEFGIHLQSHVHVICQANFRFEFPIDFRPRTALDNWENMFSTHVLLFFLLVISCPDRFSQFFLFCKNATPTRYIHLKNNASCPSSQFRHCRWTGPSEIPPLFQNPITNWILEI